MAFRSRWKLSTPFVVAFISTILIVFSIGYAVWGSSVFQPFIYGESRASKIFSIYRYFRGEFSFLAPLGIRSLDFLATPVLLSLLGVLFVFVARRKEGGSVVSVLLGYTIILSFYKVGHHQFYLPYLLLCALVIARNYAVPEFRRVLSPMALLLAWIFACVVAYDWGGAYRGDFKIIREWVGLPTFALQLYLIRELIRFHQSEAERCCVTD
jgi:hypothetical protein